MSESSAPPRIWVKESVLEADLPDFCHALTQAIYDPGMRLKIYLDGDSIHKWIISIQTNSALICALVFASTFGSFTNSDLYNTSEGATSSVADQYTAHTCYFLLVLSILLSAAGIGSSTLVLNIMPQVARPTPQDCIAFLSKHLAFVWFSAFVFPVAAVVLAVLCIILWGFFMYRTTFAITVAVVFGVVIAIFMLAFAILVMELRYRSRAFERLVKEKQFEKAYDVLMDMGLTPAASKAISKIRSVEWDSS